MKTTDGLIEYVYTVRLRDHKTRELGVDEHKIRASGVRGVALLLGVDVDDVLYITKERLT